MRAVGLLGFGCLLAVGRPTIVTADTLPRACDIYKAAHTPCVAAHSTVRALFANYAGPLYAVQRTSDGQTRQIGLLAPGDYADAASQDAFCANTTCTITMIYDQTTNGNTLTIEGRGGAVHTADVGAPADALPITAGGHHVYGVSFSGGMGYRDDHTAGVATNGQPETMYMVTSGTHVNRACCFDYGNAEIDNKDNGSGHMDAINFSYSCKAVTAAQPTLTQPWVKTDLEDGLYASDDGCSYDSLDRLQPEPYVTALLKNNGQTVFTLKYGDAQSRPLTVGYAGPLPPPNYGGSYTPMSQEGAIVLGTGGDNSNGSIGSFFEGVMTASLTPDWADDLVQADIIHVGYGGPTGMNGALQPGNEISLMTSMPNASTYLAHASQPNNAQPAVTTSVQSYAPEADRAAATWIVRRGRANNACLSFEARDLPGAFLRHVGGSLVAAPDDGSAAFTADATFCPKAGLDGSGTSFQAQDASGSYIRNYQGGAYIASDGGPQPYDATTGWKGDVSWTVTQPLDP